jgi:hypothetical protein
MSDFAVDQVLPKVGRCVRARLQTEPLPQEANTSSFSISCKAATDVGPGWCSERVQVEVTDTRIRVYRK